ncbi:ABC transporter permease [uncultured Sphaerochaeta sp.]|uniref:ABC transporter permease n=1 Tax=uncultured Sphaerochaeta sp. TaxID=886478 RepID=UPI002A0A3E5C|nr:ABC transporter permease [uncultured Sphaerochaeta sp.]
MDTSHPVLILTEIRRFLHLHSYFFTKVIRSLITCLLIFFLTFIFVRTGGNPAENFLGTNSTPEAVALFNAKWELDRPLYQQFFSYIVNILHGDLGESIIKHQPVTQLIKHFLPATLSLMIPSALISILVGILIGYLAARRHRKMSDHLILLFSTVGYSIPNFFFGVLLIFLFSILWGVLPPSGNTSFKHFIMPIITISTADLAVFTRFSRAAFIDIYETSYIESARALGIKEKRILSVHALPNAGISLLTISGFYIGSLVTGAIVTETIFSWPGLGSLLVNSVKARDFPLVQGLILFFGIIIIAMNLLTDILYGIVDPRIRKGAIK